MGSRVVLISILPYFSMVRGTRGANEVVHTELIV